MESLRKKLGVLREAQRGLQEDIRANTQLGEEVRNTSTLTLDTVVDTPAVDVQQRNRDAVDS